MLYLILEKIIMNTKKIKEGCIIDIDTIKQTCYCFECKYLWEVQCIQKKIVDLFREEEEIYLHKLHTNDWS